MEIEKSKQFIIDNKIEELNRLVVFLEELFEEWGLSIALMNSINLVLEEALSNTINYSLDKNKSSQIILNFKLIDQELSIEIIDEGMEYDPTQKEDPDINLSVEDRPIGGLGVYLIKQIMDHVSYKRTEKKNHLYMTKKIN